MLTDSRTARRETTTLLRLRSSLISLNSNSWPSRCRVSLTGRTSTKDPGKKALILFKSTVNPPFTLPLIIPVTMSFFSWAASSSIHDSARLAFSLESLVAPKPSSTVSRATLTSLPTSREKLPCSSRNSSRAITPSDLRPAWTVTQSESISITVPVTMAPGVISITVKLCSKSSAKFSLIIYSNIFN